MTTGQNKGKSGSKANFIDPPNILRQKVGYGGVVPDVIEKAQAYIQSNKTDFRPIAVDILERFETLVERAAREKAYDKSMINEITGPIMELKANGRMFRFSLLSEVAEILLNFLENIPHLDDDTFEVMAAHKNTIEVILKNNLSGDGGKEGLALSKELYAACTRYYRKHDITPS